MEQRTTSNLWRSFSYTDYWGTLATTFEVHEPHHRLSVHAQSVVETHGDDLRLGRRSVGRAQ